MSDLILKKEHVCIELFLSLSFVCIGFFTQEWLALGFG